VKLRRRKPLPPADAVGTTLPGQRRYLTRQELAAEHGASPEDIAKVEAFARQHGLKVVQSNAGRRLVRLEGTVNAFNKAFGVNLESCRVGGEVYRMRTGPVHVPTDLADVVQAVVGLDDRTQAWPHFRIGKATGATLNVATSARPLAPTEVARLYNSPTGLDGSGQTIGIIELGGGFRQEELRKYFSGLGVRTPEVVAVGVDGGQNSPGDDPLDPENSDVEVLLDIEVAGAVAPGARLVVYFAPDASGQSFLNAISQAVNDDDNKPTVISISWGGPESASTRQFQKEFDQVLQAAAHLGITVCVASGDDGSADFPVDDPERPWDGHAHVDFPASSPFALACGGTHLEGTGGTISREVVWHEGPNVGTGGGVSRFFALPSYQTGAHVPAAKNPPGPVMRGVPDVAGNAAQATGYRILADGQVFPDPDHDPPLPGVGGTSAVAPLWAGLVALLNQGLGHQVGFVNPLLYRFTGAFHDITSGNNGDYQAAPGWDPCTGLGTPDGAKLLAALKG
jgi:kumamolisin